MDVVITVDTEADNQWDLDSPPTTENLACLPRFQRLCDRYGLKPTYLCTYEVASAPLFVDYLLAAEDAGRCEVGAHLHPWTTPPFDRVFDGAGRGRPFPSELPSPLFVEKLEALTAQIQRERGRAPTSHRAGRWGFAAEHVSVLKRLGYVADCSVTPGVSWQSTAGVFNYGPAPMTDSCAPFELGADEGGEPLLEVPVTIVAPDLLPGHRARRARRLARRTRRGSLLARAVNRTVGLDPVWFRPFPHVSTSRLIEVADTLLAADAPVIEMMFHSSELLPGGSPYNDSARDVEALYAKLEAVFAHLARLGLRGCTLSGFATEFRRSSPRASSSPYRVEQVDDANLGAAQEFVTKKITGSDPSRDARWFRWQYVCNPYSKKGIVVCRDEDAVVGFSGFLPCPVRVGQNKMIAAFSMNTLVAAEHRKRGLAGRIHRFRESLYDFALASAPWKDHRAVYQRLGFSDFGRWYVAYVSSKAPELNVGKGFLKSATSYLLWSVLGQPDRRLEVSDTSVPPADVETLLDQDGASFVCAAHGRDYLEWRFVEHPYITYRFVTLREGTRLLAMAVVRQAQGGYVLSDAYGDSDLLPTLFRAVAAALGQECVRSVFVGAPLGRAFLKAGWCIYPTKDVLMGRARTPALRALAARQAWCFFGGEADKDR